MAKLEGVVGGSLWGCRSITVESKPESLDKNPSGRTVWGKGRSEAVGVPPVVGSLSPVVRDAGLPSPEDD